MRDAAWEKLQNYYPKVVDDQGKERTVIAYLWARTVQNPNPANPVHVPLVSSWWLSTKKGHEAWVEPVWDGKKFSYLVHKDSNGPTGDDAWTIKYKKGAKSQIDGTPFDYEYVREQGKLGKLGAQMIAIVYEDDRGRGYCNVDSTQENASIVSVDHQSWFTDAELSSNSRWFSPPLYGFTKFRDIFSPRQLLLLQTFCELIPQVAEKIKSEGNRSDRNLREYAAAVCLYLSLCIGRIADYSSTLCSWHVSAEKMRNTFGRQALPMVWDFAEVNPFSSSTGNFGGQLSWITKVLDNLTVNSTGQVTQADAATRDYNGYVISTDPPYYDNIGYADLSDYFYVWIRQAYQAINPELVATMLSPKAEELVANQFRLGGKKEAEQFFEQGFNKVFAKMRENAGTDVPITVYYAYKQSDKGKDGISSAGWHTILGGIITQGWMITATWPIRTEITNRLTAKDANALASSIVLACRPRPEDAPVAMRRQLIAELKRELPVALRAMIHSGIQPVDLAQAAIGPGMAVFSKYAMVREADGSQMTVKDALIVINQVLDEVLGEQESNFDEDTRFAVTWYRSYGWNTENSGIADQLARSSGTTLDNLERGGIFEAKAGKSRLLSPSELSESWDPTTDDRVSVWESVVRLAAVLSTQGQEAVTETMALLGDRVELDAVRELGFLLFHEATKNGDTQDANLFNALVSIWSEVAEEATAKARELMQAGKEQFLF